MGKAARYDTVVLTEDVGGHRVGEKGAVVEAYTIPYEAYDIELVTDEGETTGLLEAVRPEQIKVAAPASRVLRIASVRIDADGSRAAISFSDGTETTVSAEDLQARLAA